MPHYLKVSIVTNSPVLEALTYQASTNRDNHQVDDSKNHLFPGSHILASVQEQPEYTAQAVFDSGQRYQCSI